MGAYGLAVAAAFAVALAVLASAPGTAEAGPPDGGDNIHVGDTIYVTFTATSPTTRALNARVAQASDVKGLFMASGRSDVSCAADVPDDTDTDTDETVASLCDVGTPPADGAAAVTDGIVTLAFEVTSVKYGADDNTAATLSIETDAASAGTFAADSAAAVSKTATGAAIGTPVYYGHDHSISSPAGTTVTVTFETNTAAGDHNGDSDGNGGDRYRITTDSTGTATFAHNGLSALQCADVDGDTTGKCDADKAANRIGLRVAIADDSPRGEIFVQRYARSLTGQITVADQVTITVSGPSTAVGSLDVKPTRKSIPATGTGTTLNVTLTNANNTPARGIAVTLIATGVGQFNDPDCGPTNNSQFCRLNTDAEGEAAVDFQGARASGTATIVVTAGGLSEVVSITVHGDADSIATELHEGTVEAGGEPNYVIVTVLDSSDRPIEGVNPSVKSSGALSTDDEAGLDPPGTANDIPACGDGTNKDGKCAIEVTAATGTVAGEETVTVQLTRTGKTALSDSSTVEVVGKPAEVVVTAPESVEPESTTEITVTVYDANGKLAGTTGLTARKLDGSGFIDPPTKSTKNGVATFEYSAGLSGAAILRFQVSDASSVRENVTITIGEPEPEAPPEPPAPEPSDATLTVVGNLGVFSGGSAGDLAAAADAACPGGAQIAAQDANDDWQFWSSSAPAFVNNLFSDAFPDGFGASTPVWITSCDGSGMDSEGDGMGG